MDLIKQFEQKLTETEVKTPAKGGFQAGAVVRLKKGPADKTAEIESMMDDIKGAVVLKTPLGGSKNWNVEDLELMIQDGVFEAAAPTSDKLYYVMVPANVFSGRYYEYKAAQVKVLASSKEEAIQLINDNKDDVVRFLGTRRVQPSGKPLLPPKEVAKKNVFFKDTYYVRELGGTSSNDVLTRHGGFKQVRISKPIKESVLPVEGGTIGGAADELYTRLKNSKEGRMADWVQPNGDTARVEFECRYFGKWVVPDGEVDDGDYDWEVPTPETMKAVEEKMDLVRQLYPKFKFKVETSEKNWLLFTITPKK